MKAIKIFNVVLAILLLISLGFLLGKKYDIIIDSNNKIAVVNQDVNEQKIRRLFTLIDKQYIKKLDTDSLIDVTLNYVLQGLDPHSAYLNAHENSIIADISGVYNGIGVEFAVIDDTLTIVRNLQDSPNKKFFIPGDKLLKINHKNITGDHLHLIKNIIELDNQFSILLMRNKEKVQLNVPKKSIPVKNIDCSYMLSPEMGYIKLSHFSENASSEMHNALLTLKDLGAKKIILDIRDNGGGLLDEAVAVADEFLPKNKTIVYLQNEKDNAKTYYKSTNNGVFKEGGVYILINENSASASEVLAGSLQDNDVGMVLGRRSFGKGLVQKEISMDDGSTFRITTAKYYTPSGRCIQKDYSDSQTYSSEILNRYYSGEMFDESKMLKNNKLKKVTPKGKVVYGGGGIIPDVFVPMEPLQMNKAFYENNGGDIVKATIIREVGKNVPKYYQFEESDFIQHYNVDDLFDIMNKELIAKGVHIDTYSEKILKTYIKAFLAKIIYGESAYYKIWNEQDNVIKKVKELSGK